MGQGKAVASLVLGIIGVVLCQIVFISLPCQIIGLILGILAKRQRAGGMAIAGIVLSCVGLAFSLLVLFFVILGLIMAMPGIRRPTGYTMPLTTPACAGFV